jgi:hypothetical protein
MDATESTFREAGRVIFSSVLFSGIVLAIFALVRIVSPGIMPDPRQLIVDPHAYAINHYRLLARTVFIGFVFALVLAFISHSFLARRQGGARIRQVSAWTKVFRNDCPRGMVPHVRVRLDSGSTYLGRVAEYSPAGELVDRELVIGPPLKVKPRGSMESTQLPDLYERVILRGDALKVISVEYRKRPLSEESPQLVGYARILIPILERVKERVNRWVEKLRGTR